MQVYYLLNRFPVVGGTHRSLSSHTGLCMASRHTVTQLHWLQDQTLSSGMQAQVQGLLQLLVSLVEGATLPSLPALVLKECGRALPELKAALLACGDVQIWPQPAVDTMQHLLQLYTLLLERAKEVHSDWRSRRRVLAECPKLLAEYLVDCVGGSKYFLYTTSDLWSLLVLCIVEALLQVLPPRNLSSDPLTVAVLQVKVGQELLQLLLRDRGMAHLVRRFAAHSLMPASICSPRSLQCSPNQGAVLQFFTALARLLSRQPAYTVPGMDLPSSSRVAGSSRPASGTTDEQQDSGTDTLVEAAKEDDGRARSTEGMFGREGWGGSSSLSPGKQSQIASWSAQGPISSRINTRRTQQQLSSDQDDGRPKALTRKAALQAAFGFLVDPSQAVLLQLLEQCSSSAETGSLGSRHQRTSSFGHAAPEAVELRTQVLQLLAAVFRVPGRSNVTTKQITDHYVHYHFLHFAKLYTAQQHLDSHVLDLCRLHLAVLRSLAAHKVKAAGSPDLCLPAADLCRALAMGLKLPVP